MAFQLGLQRSLKLSKSTGLATVAVLSSSYIFLRKLHSRFNAISQADKERQRKERLIVISGCDSGLGYSMAVWAATLGYKVLAGCLNDNGEGSQKLLKEFPEQIYTSKLNVTERDSLANFQVSCKDILRTHEGKLELWAIVANAAVSTMGEFLWQTGRQREHQMDVNFWGTVNLVSEFRTLLLQTKPRVIVIGSDCSEYPLPYLSSYCASKAALNSWVQSFRFEMGKYGISVTTYQPRDFARRSGLLANIEVQYNQMKAEMDSTDKQFYGDYFDNFMKGKQEFFSSNKKDAVTVVDSPHHRNSFINLLENDISRIAVFRDFSFAEKVFHGLYMTLPQSYVDRLVNLLLNPKKIQWNKPNQDNK